MIRAYFLTLSLVVVISCYGMKEERKLYCLNTTSIEMIVPTTRPIDAICCIKNGYLAFFSNGNVVSVKASRYHRNLKTAVLWTEDFNQDIVGISLNPRWYGFIEMQYYLKRKEGITS